MSNRHCPATRYEFFACTARNGSRPGEGLRNPASPLCPGFPVSVIRLPPSGGDASVSGARGQAPAGAACVPADHLARLFQAYQGACCPSRLGCRNIDKYGFPLIASSSLYILYKYKEPFFGMSRVNLQPQTRRAVTALMAALSATEIVPTPNTSSALLIFSEPDCEEIHRNACKSHLPNPRSPYSVRRR